MWAEVRAWSQFAFVAIAAVVALVALLQNMRQRQVENALKFVSNFKDSLSDEDWEAWRHLFYMAGEPGGAGHGNYITDKGEVSSIGDYFSEGSPDGYAVSRMAESLEVVCHQALSGYADARTVYYELWQPIWNFSYWLSGVNSAAGGTLLEKSFPSIGRFATKFSSKVEHWPSRVICYVE